MSFVAGPITGEEVEGLALEETSGEREEDLKEEIGHEIVLRTDLGAEAEGIARWTSSQEETLL